jgi:hypothetical protein
MCKSFLLSTDGDVVTRSEKRSALRTLLGPIDRPRKPCWSPRMHTRQRSRPVPQAEGSLAAFDGVLPEIMMISSADRDAAPSCRWRRSSALT